VPSASFPSGLCLLDPKTGAALDPTTSAFPGRDLEDVAKVFFAVGAELFVGDATVRVEEEDGIQCGLRMISSSR
jgi:hypothetical protein